jgi:hypothetical protein
MHKAFKIWVENHRGELYCDNVVTDAVVITSDDLLDPSTTVDYCTKLCVGRISVWSSGHMDSEILDIGTEARLFWKHLEVNRDVDYDRMLEDFFTIMKRGQI